MTQNGFGHRGCGCHTSEVATFLQQASVQSLNFRASKGLLADPLKIGSCPKANNPKTLAHIKAVHLKLNNTVWNGDRSNARTVEYFSANKLKLRIFPEVNTPKRSAAKKALPFKFDNPHLQWSGT